MSRPNQTTQRRKELLPIVAQTFAELGYRRTTTAELAQRCGVRENILYRLWADKKAMFIAAIAYVYDSSVAIWEKLLQDVGDGRTAAERLLAYESQHHGEYGQYRIVFAGLSETDDPQVQAALAGMYRRYQRFIQRQIGIHRPKRAGSTSLDATLVAWAVIGLGTVTNIGRELGLLGPRERRRLFTEIGRALLGE
jgi:AcrR family transcriptional regulator